MQVPVGRIPKFINARSPQGLQRLMLQTQAKLGYGVKWFDIQFVNRRWYAFYYDNDDITLINVEDKLGTNNS